MNPLGNHDIERRLREISDGYVDALGPRARSRILASAKQASRSAPLLSPFVPAIPRMLAAAAVVVILALPALHLRRQPAPGPDTAVRDLQVTAVGGHVVLTWKDGNQPRRVVRATSREDLAHLGRLPAQVVSGQRWVDDHAGDAAVVYYLVE